ncbi:MAG TPA: nucleotide disphospho-sugar-binding domain-containing protein [Solirubrobacteraceae bacterium]|jgi:UDP:flavonoid glycosyltransferase YjiC (YdhE family)|nr:nucleotide disphospho-sugar-binding domain-containing protein [Solirubrobacteraceae bacterium]
MIALGRELVARGHDVTLQTWTRWRADVEAQGMAFARAPEYQPFPTSERSLTPYQAVERATRDTLPLVRELEPAAIVADILTLAPALAGELEDVPVATLVPHLDPRMPPASAPFSCGARLPRTAAGRALWRTFDPLLRHGLQLGRRQLNDTRARLGLPALQRVHGGISETLCLVATFPQLEYARAWPACTHVVGPLLWEPPSQDADLPEGDDSLVLVAPSTSQDPEHRLLRAALAGLATLPVRVLASTNRQRPDPPFEVPANARLVDWLSYARAMSACDVVVCHGGHGTVARALSSGCAVVVVPAGGDMNETAARVDWAGVGVRLPRRMVGARGLRLAVGRALARPALRARAGELAAWTADHDGAARAAGHVEALAAGRVSGGSGSSGPSARSASR